ncbi:MAG: MATE family efflux transporter [Hyphomicrobiales bacterium]
MREARALSGISVAVSATMFAQFSISAVETLIVARLGVEQLAGVTLALSIYLLLFLFALGVVTAVTPIVAGAYGRGDMEDLRLSGQQAFWVGLSFSVPGMLILLACRSLAGSAIGAGVEADSAAAYLAGAAWGLPAWVSYVAVRCLAIATGRVRITTVIMLASVPVHAGLTWLLVFGGLGLPAFGAFGAGVAYALTAFAALALLAVVLQASPQGPFGSVFRRPFVLDRNRYGAIIRLGIPFACRILLREGVLPCAAFVIAPFGAAAVAAHAVAARVVELTGVFSFGFSDAANMRVSYAIGASAPDRARHAGWIAIQLAAGVSLVVAGALIAERLSVARWVLGDTDPAGVLAAAALLPVAACLQFLEGVQSAAGGALSGLRDAKGPLLIAIFGSWIVGMPAGILLARLAAAPVNGMWWGLAVGGCLTTCLYLFRLRRKMARKPGHRSGGRIGPDRGN